MGFLSVLSSILSLAQTVLPIIASVRAASAPDASNEALLNTAKAVQLVAPIVQHVEAISNAAGTQLMSGAQKLALAQSVVQDAHASVVAAGGTTESFDTYWQPINAAITTYCAMQKAGTLPSFLTQTTA